MGSNPTTRSINMFKEFSISKELADLLEKELYSQKVNWTYYPDTVAYYENTTEENQKYIDNINVEHGPIKDSQRFSHSVYNLKQAKYPFEALLSSLDSPLRQDFKFFPIFINEIQDTFFPHGYEITRCAVNRQLISPTRYLNGIHPDAECEKTFTVLYYVNDSDGDTLFFNKDNLVKSVAPVKGTGVIFPSTMWHAGACPTKSNTRTVINILFRQKNEPSN